MRRFRRVPAVLVDQHAGLDQVQEHLLDEERIAFSLGIYGADQFLGRFIARQPAQHGADLVLSQPL
jgi:hypothetical protein